MKLIINADDFGITTKVSEGIIHGMKQGLITDTSALVNSKHFEKAVSWLLKQELQLWVYISI